MLLLINLKNDRILCSLTNCIVTHRLILIKVPMVKSTQKYRKKTFTRTFYRPKNKHWKGRKFRVKVKLTSKLLILWKFSPQVTLTLPWCWIATCILVLIILRTLNYEYVEPLYYANHNDINQN